MSNTQQNTGSASGRKAIEGSRARVVAANLSLDVSGSFATLT
jgi:hypothetical protein